MMFQDTGEFHGGAADDGSYAVVPSMVVIIIYDLENDRHTRSLWPTSPAPPLNAEPRIM